MQTSLTSIVQTVSHVFITTAHQSPAPLLIVAAFVSASVLLYGLTRGKEFLIAGYSSLLFLAPFVQFS